VAGAARRAYAVRVTVCKWGPTVPRNDQPWKRDRDDDARDDEPRRKKRRRDEDEDDEFDDYEEEDRRDGRLSRTDLREIAGRQRGIIMCILGYFCLIPIQFAIPEENRIYLALTLIPLGLTAAVFVFMLAVKLYGQNSGIVYGILTLVPLVGLIVLLIINQKATTTLKDNGVRVGLLGAKSSDL
jgi:hypothetical protein